MRRVLCLDWGGTVMEVLPYDGPMAGWPEVAAVPGVEKALRELVESYRIALLTSAGESTEPEVRAALARVGLDGYFERVILSRDTGFPKSDPAFYRKALSLLESRPEHAVMVGDSYENDIVSAKKAGLKAVWYSPAGSTPGGRSTAGGAPAGYTGPERAPAIIRPDAVISDMSALPAAVASLWGASSASGTGSGT